MSRLLVVDEDSGRRLILRSRLAEGGHEIVLAESGARGLLEVRGASFDTILVSARLSNGIDGHETCRRLRASVGRDFVPIVVFDESAPASEDMARAFEAGCDAYVTRSELPALEHVLRAFERTRGLIADLCTSGVPAEPAAARAAEPELRAGTDQAAALRELAAGRPDGVLVVDADGLVRHADRGACDLFGARVEGQHLGSLASGSGLEAYVRDARSEPREGLRFELQRRGRPTRALAAVAVPFLLQPRDDAPVLRAVLLHDQQRRRVAAEALRTHEPALSRAEAGPLVEAAREAYTPASLIGDSAAARQLREDVTQALTDRASVLLLGEVGTGRRRVARVLHYASSLSGAFLELRCAALSPKELELELFGCARANGRGDRPGQLHLAHNGTLFLDEANELPPALQERLCAFLESGSFARTTGARPERIDVRVVASVRPHDERGDNHRADINRADGFAQLAPALLQRLSARVIRVPTLDDRREDVEPIARALLARLGSVRGITSVSEPALVVLREHSWSGHVAELEACLEHAVARARGPEIELADLPRAFHGLPPREIVPQPAARSARSTAHAVAGLAGHELQPAAPRGREALPWDIHDHEPVSLELYEQKALLRAIAQCGGDKLAAARLLRLGKSTLYRKLKRYGIR